MIREHSTSSVSNSIAIVDSRVHSVVYNFVRDSVYATVRDSVYDIVSRVIHHDVFAAMHGYVVDLDMTLHD